ncbi:OmpA family protein [Polyangium sp. 15x6]|uniref:OmpA family protein n=1 Tax=Polyangium sp. 15x6 TaxID=3042687 RepID=UPI00249B9141|nr:OmpA family protein [Polyangium sp. 15x6]MDI3285479.1 OmpA family protein [Polyangium sp. 15x6]
MTPGPRFLPFLFPALAFVASPRLAAADETPSLAVEPAPAGDRAFLVEHADVRGHLLPSARLLVDYARRPLVLRNDADELDPIVSDQTFFHALASLSLFYRATLSLDVPFSIAQAGSAPPSGDAFPRAGVGASFGDIRLGARVRLAGGLDEAGQGAALGLSASLWLPTATDGYAGDGAIRGRFALVAEATGKRLHGAFSGGLRTRPAVALPGVLPTRVATSLTFGLAGGFFVDGARSLSLGGELSAELPFLGGARLFDPRATVAHALVTGHYRITGGPLEIGLAMGPGLGRGAGSADVRVLALLGYAPEKAKPPPDRDEDGIPDKSDACIDLVGVESGDPLLHGCPEPPPDYDGDAIPDENDACPRAAGEATFVRKTHGCPKDTDEDGVPDKKDACPTEPGPKPPEGNGCPKPKEPEPPPVASLAEQEIVISQQVQFETGTAVLRPESDGVLGEVARVLTDHPEVTRVEVQGHTDDTGSPDVNRKLGQDRAESVVEWLVRRGIARGRLVPKGYGSDKPIADNTTEEGRSKNRRVEFRILEKKPAAKDEAKPAKGGAK